MTAQPHTPTRIELEREGLLPEPTRERWQPLRVGLVDLFHYDHQEFWFRDGRLLWRGNNGTGKSKVLALTLPFLFDGDLAAHRVEPDGDSGKRMEWNLLLGGRYQDRLGYSWIEFGRLDGGGGRHFLTAGIALKAVEGRGIADRWYFVTDQRIGAELPLLTSGGNALGRERLTEAIGARGRVVRTGEHYRRLLDDHLFHLGSDRYSALIDLLIQLRQPQLSKRPDPKLLSDALSEALPPLGADLLADAAAGFHDLEHQRDELTALAETHDHLLKFQRRYGIYASVAARRQAGELRTAHSRYEESGRELKGVRETAAEAAGQQKVAQEELDRQHLREVALLAEQGQLRESAEIRELDNARRAHEQAKAGAQLAARGLTRAQRDDESARANHDRAVAEADSAEQRLDACVAEASGLAQESALAAAHGQVLAQPDSLDEPLPLRRNLRQAADDRSAGIDAVRSLQVGTAEAERRAVDAARKLADVEAERDTAADTLNTADGQLQDEVGRLLAQWQAFAGRVDAVQVPFPDEVGLADWAQTLDGPDPASTVLDERTASVRNQRANQRAAVVHRKNEIASVIDGLTAERVALEAGVLQEPPGSATRSREGRTGRSGAPLWRVVDVRADVLDLAGQSGLEAALQASGLLDAWITVDGRLLDPEDQDAVLIASAGPSPADRNLADLLIPDIDPQDESARALSESTIARVLGSIEVAPTVAVADHGDPATLIGLDGTYRLGPLHGRWAKPRSEFLGSSAREQARRARIEQLSTEIELAEAELGNLEIQIEQIDRANRQLGEQLQGKPSDQSLRSAHAELAAATVQLARQEAKLAPARGAVAEARDHLSAVRTELVDTATDLGLPPGSAELEQVATALGRYRGAISDLVAAVERRRDRRRESTERRSVAEATAEALQEAQDVQIRAQEQLLAEDTRLRTLEENLGATVADLKTRLERVAEELRRIGEHRPGLQRTHTEATQRLGQAEGREQQLLADQADLQQARDSAVNAWRGFAGTGLLTVALPDLEVLPAQRPWAAEPAIRLARQTESGLSDVDDSDQSWKRVQDDITRRFAELSEALSRHGHQAHADLVEGRFVVSVLYSGRERPPAQLAGLLAEEIELRERELTGRERQVLEEHLVGDVAGRLQELITEADEMVTWMNAELSERPTSTGMRLRLGWQPDPEGPEGLREARSHLLRQTSQLWSDTERAAVRDFLQRQIQRVRAEQPLGTWTEHLRQALDYRGWHRFVIERFQDGSWRPAVGPASGGERVLTVSLPLFAAASAHYRSAHPLAPRLVLLDEAFAGVDDDARAKSLGLLTQFDLDVAMTSEREWGFYPTVPGIATYQLVRHEGIDAVHVTAWEWDGSQPQQVSRPTLPPREAAEPSAAVQDEGLF